MKPLPPSFEDQELRKKIFWVFALSSGVYFIQGIESLPSQALFYYMKETLHFSAERIMFLSSITISAWLVKPFIGYIIDNFLSKRAWIFIALFLDIFSVLILGLLSLPIFLIITLLLLNSTNSSFRDVAVDGIMCIEGKKYNLTGKIQSVQWMSISVAGLITGISGGYIAEKFSYKTGFLCLIPFYLLVALACLFYKEEKPEKSSPSSKRNLISELKRLFKDKRLLLVCVFIFLYKYSPSFGTPLFFIQRDQFRWSKLWIGFLGTLGTIFEIIGAIFYFKFSKRLNFRKWLIFSVFLGAFTTLSYLYYTPVTAVVYNILYSLIGMFIFLLIMDFMARSTTPGLEATSFALLCSVSNLALVASNLSGAFLLSRIGLKPLIVVSSLTSFLCLFLINKIEFPCQNNHR